MVNRVAAYKRWTHGDDSVNASTPEAAIHQSEVR
jgi:hypothetical protein